MLISVKKNFLATFFSFPLSLLLLSTAQLILMFVETFMTVLSLSLSSLHHRIYIYKVISFHKKTFFNGTVKRGNFESRVNIENLQF